MNPDGKERLRVGFDVSAIYPWRAGGSTYAFELLRHLAELDDCLDLTLVDGTGRGALEYVRETLPQLDGVPGHRSAMLPLVHVLPGPWAWHPKTLRYAMRFDSFLLSPLWQVVNATPRLATRRLPGAPPLDVYHWSGDAFTRVPGAAHVVTIHDTIPLLSGEWHPKGDRLNHFLRLNLIARLADRIIADSSSAAADISRMLRVPKDRIDVIPLAASPEFVPEPASDDRDVLELYGLRKDEYVIFVGTIEPRKNVVRLAQAFRRVIDADQRITARLVLAGKHGWMTDPIDRGLEELKLGDRLCMPGRIPAEHLPALLRHARCAAYVSLYEGFGLPPLEAMSCGTPVLASTTSSLPEVVGDGGILVDPLDVEAIAAGLRALLVNDAERNALAARALARARTFSWERTARLTVESYGRAVGTTRTAITSR